MASPSREIPAWCLDHTVFAVMIPCHRSFSAGGTSAANQSELLCLTKIPLPN
jgi:hypothetical protein